MMLPFQVKVDPTHVHLFNQTLITNAIHNDSNSSDSSIDLLPVVAIWLVLLMTIFLGATGNILVLYVYTNRQDSKTCTFFIKMLAIVDLTICLILAPLELYQLAAGKKLSKYLFLFINYDDDQTKKYVAQYDCSS